EFIRFTQRYPNVRPFLDEYRKSTGVVGNADVSLIMEQYQATLSPVPSFIDLAGAFAPEPTPESVPPEPKKSEETDLGKWLETEPLLVDERLLAHVLGDSFAEGSGLE